MLYISPRHKDRFNEIMARAGELGAAFDLLEKLTYLHTYNDPFGDGSRCIVVLVPEARRDHRVAGPDMNLSFDIYWKLVSRRDDAHPGEEPAFTGRWGTATSMNGGLIFREEIDTNGSHYSIHT